MFALSELTTTVLTAGLALITAVVLAVLGTRQRLEVEYDIELRKRRIEAYQALWKILEPLAYYSPPSAVTYASSGCVPLPASCAPPWPRMSRRG